MALSSEDLAASLSLGEGGCGVAGQENKTICKTRWTMKKAEHQRVDAFKVECWIKLLRIPWTARRSNQSVLKEISPEYSLEKTDAEAEAPVLWPRDVKY